METQYRPGGDPPHPDGEPLDPNYRPNGNPLELRPSGDPLNLGPNGDPTETNQTPMENHRTPMETQYRPNGDPPDLRPNGDPIRTQYRPSRDQQDPHGEPLDPSGDQMENHRDHQMFNSNQITRNKKTQHTSELNFKEKTTSYRTSKNDQRDTKQTQETQETDKNRPQRKRLQDNRDYNYLKNTIKMENVHKKTQNKSKYNKTTSKC